jgi:hypothetical protein
MGGGMTALDVSENHCVLLRVLNSWLFFYLGSTRAKGSGTTSRALSELTRRREEKKSSRTTKRHRRHSPSPDKKKRHRYEEHSDYENSEGWHESDDERETKVRNIARLMMRTDGLNACIVGKETCTELGGNPICQLHSEHD